MAEKSGMTKTQVKEGVDALIELIGKELRAGNTFNFFGLAKFKVKLVKARPAGTMGRNPATGESMVLKAKPASKSVSARALKALKSMA